MSDTPRTDLEFANWDESPEVKALGELARQLERELATERCETCNCELSACGEQNIDGTPSMDCQLCQASDRINTLERELAEAETALDDSSRALKMLQRHQNGAREITKCPNWETLEDWVTQLMSQLTTQRAALEKAREALEMCRMVVQNEINVREMLGKPTQVWPDLLTGCVSGGGIEDAITTITAVLEATR